MTSQQSTSATLTDAKEFYAMFADLFTDKQDCEKDDVLKCNSFKRIKILLKQCDDIVNEAPLIDSATQNKIHDLIHHQLGQDTYTSTNLLNDYHHVKYGHDVEDDVEKFDKIFRASSHQNCNISKCKYLKHHYRDRTQISTQSENTFNEVGNSYASNLLSRVHTYFIHSYDLNKLTVDEITKMNQELKTFKITIQSEDDHEVLLQQKKLEMLFEIMNNKKGKALKTVNNKYIEPAQEEYQLFSDVLLADDGLDALLKFFDENGYDTEAIHDDLEDKQQSNIYTYFQEKLKDKINQIDVLKEVSAIYMPVIKASNLLDHDQQNKTFLLTQFCGFTGSKHDAAKIFLDTTNWDLSISINRYFMFDGDPSQMEDLNSTDIDENNHNPRESTKFEALDLKDLNVEVNQDVYSLGTKFWYWLSMKNQPNYIAAKHKDLKFEILYHNEIDFNVSGWNSLDEECNVKLSSNKVRKMMSNGYDVHIYAIRDNIRFDLEHIRALLLYTNYTAWCSFFCGVLRKGNKAEVSAVANWAKLLIECVQCYGCLISIDDTFYRGINREFTFKKFVARFNCPLSTTTELIKAAEFAGFAEGSDGLVVELCCYDIINTVFTLDCSVISAFTEEREMLFYGGDCILRIQSIHQLDNNKWKSYEDFVKATDGITRLMNGLTCKRFLNASVKKAMRFIFRSILNISNKTNIESLPKYIVERLINYHIVDRKAAVEMDYDELIARYTWIHVIFVKDKDKGILNINNICRVFHKSNAIIITMPDESGNTRQNVQYAESTSNILDDANDDVKDDSNVTNGKVTQQFCQSLKDDLHQVAHDDIFINKLQFNWSTRIPLEAKFLLINTFANDKFWKLESTSTSILITRREPEEEEEKTEEKNDTQDGDIGSVQGLDDENGSAAESEEEEDEFMTFVWEIEEKELDNFKKTGECKSDEIEIEAEKYNAYKWEWALKSTGTEAELTLTIKSLPEQLGAVKMNIEMSCDELLYIENHEGVVLTLRDELRIKLKDKFDTNVVVPFDLNKFEKENLKKLKFKCNIETLVNYDLWGGIFSEIEKPLFVARSELNNLLVYGVLNEIHEYNSQKIKASPLSIYELIYKYFLMMIKIREKGGLFVWNFDNKPDIKLFTNCAKGDVITSRKFEVNGCVFYLELTPNGWGRWPEGKCIVWIAVHSFPKHVISIELQFRVTCELIEYSEDKIEQLSDPRHGIYSTAPNTMMDGTKFIDLKSWDFKMYVEVRKMFDKDGNEIYLDVVGK